MMLVIQAESVFYLRPGLELDVEGKIKNCDCCIKGKTVQKPCAELVNTISI